MYTFVAAAVVETWQGFYFKFLDESNDEKIFKIGQRSLKFCTNIGCMLFWRIVYKLLKFHSWDDAAWQCFVI